MGFGNIDFGKLESAIHSGVFKVKTPDVATPFSEVLNQEQNKLAQEVSGKSAAETVTFAGNPLDFRSPLVKGLDEHSFKIETTADYAAKKAAENEKEVYDEKIRHNAEERKLEAEKAERNKMFENVFSASNSMRDLETIIKSPEAKNNIDEAKKIEVDTFTNILTEHGTNTVDKAAARNLATQMVYGKDDEKDKIKESFAALISGQTKEHQNSITQNLNSYSTQIDAIHKGTKQDIDSGKLSDVEATKLLKEKLLELNEAKYLVYEGKRAIVDTNRDGEVEVNGGKIAFKVDGKKVFMDIKTIDPNKLSGGSEVDLATFKNATNQYGDVSQNQTIGGKSI